ncbi:transcriptional regulator [Bacillus sp. AFS023182]|uniref:helix-turn-helix transcriptional regulator n=1 Tax=Bacillales TaxID=1385 RepID=UPI000BF91F1D|nr:helix-turn-helix transcriptional regulator [Bacillus sp. AFS023182]PFE03783.1 transcriptional regulator [Bacillus sp. AFS023182]
MQDKLISFRMSKRLTQKDMAELLGIDKRTYINKEHSVTQFKANEMFLIAQYFGAEIGEIFLPTNFMKHEVLGVEVVESETHNIG